MTRTFLLTVELDTVTAEELQLLANEILDATESLGATSCKPWENPTLTQAQPMQQTYLTQPPPIV